ncbi:MAG: low molecular weight phosphotyrosine protein phosphatase [Pseudomonadales bacterium]|nr:low molecular weight phosphotyrosine protein phosphatase [Pseudomonadales bacterium]
MTNVLFVCLGNICRSPTAEGVMRKKLQQAGLSDTIKVDSCGTGSWHVGSSPDERTISMAEQYGYDLSELRARKLSANDYLRFDYILAMDTRNLADVIKTAPADFQGEIKLLLDFAPGDELEVPDPYFGGESGFLRVIQLIEAACDGFISQYQLNSSIDSPA